MERFYSNVLRGGGFDVDVLRWWLDAGAYNGGGLVYRVS